MRLYSINHIELSRMSGKCIFTFKAAPSGLNKPCVCTSVCQKKLEVMQGCRNIKMNTFNFLIASIILKGGCTRFEVEHISCNLLL